MKKEKIMEIIQERDALYYALDGLVDYLTAPEINVSPGKDVEKLLKKIRHRKFEESKNFNHMQVERVKRRKSFRQNKE